MKLKLVTWEGDLTQFLVDAEDNIEAIEIAKNANRAIDRNYKYDPEDEDDASHLRNVEDSSCYEVEDVDNLNMLESLMFRPDCGGMYGGAIVFWD